MASIIGSLFSVQCMIFVLLLFLQMENQVIVSDYSQMDRILREERTYLLNICKKIKKAGCNVLLIQKSILRYRCTVGVSACERGGRM